MFSLGDVAVRSLADILSTMLQEDDLPLLDPNASGRRVRLAAAVCAALVVSALIILLMDTRGTESCPYWRVSEASAGYLWTFLAIVAPGAAWTCYVAFDWAKFTRLIYSRAAAFEKEAEDGSFRTRIAGSTSFRRASFPMTT
jgi:hypothetical protein